MHGLVRCGRGCAVGLAIVAIAGLGHLAGGGHADLGPALLMAMLVVACVIGGVLSAHEWSMLRLLALLVTAQAVCHVALEASMTSDAAPLIVGGHGAGPIVMADMGSGQAVSTQAPSAAVMLVEHAIAVVATAWMLRRLEAGVLRAAELVAHRWWRPRSLVLPTIPVPDLPLAAVLVRPLVALVRLCDVARRGPPLRRTPVTAPAT